MHIYFSGIGGAGIGPLAEIAHKAGYEVSGSDKQDSSYLEYLRHHGITRIHIGQSREAIAAVHAAQSIDWFVYTAALPLENPNPPELAFCRDKNIKTSKRDALLNLILRDKQLQLIAIAGTHGKTTATALVVWLFKQAKEPISYLLPAKVSFGDMGEFNPKSQYFVYEADEFDRNFLAYEPALSLITGVSWDHHEIFPTREDYQAAFREFIGQSKRTLIWQEDADYLGLGDITGLKVLDSANSAISAVKLPGKYNRLDAWLAIQAVHQATQSPLADLVQMASRFPGLGRRMEQIIPNLYSDYAHTPEKIRGGLNVALEMASEKGQSVVVVYEPLTNRRQHYMIDEYKDCFSGARQVYWLPSYLAREDSKQPILTPAELIARLADPAVAQPIERGTHLKHVIRQHLDKGDMVVAMSGGGGNSLDDWIRRELQG